MANKYTPTEWKDRNVQYPLRYTLDRVAGAGTFSDGDEVDMTVTAGTVTEAGTDITASEMNNLEEGVQEANDAKYSNDNLLSNDIANCSTTTGFTAGTCSVALDTTNQVSGTSCIKATLSGATGTVDVDVFDLLETGKFYLFTAKLRNGDATNLTLSFESDDQDVDGDTITTTSYSREGVAIKPSDFNGATVGTLRVTITGSSSKFVYIDELLMREITASDYALTEANQLSKYPFSTQEGIKTTDEVINLDSYTVDGEMKTVVEGRTVVNLLDDDDAGLEVTTGWTDVDATSSNNTNELEGTICRRLVLNSGTGYSYKDFLSKMDITKYYMISVYIKNYNISNYVELNVNCVGDAGIINKASSGGTTWERVSVALQPSDFDGASEVRVQLLAVGSSAQYAYFDALMINEITKTEYDELADPEDASDLLPKYPYHRGLKGASGICLMNNGKNLFNIDEVYRNSVASRWRLWIRLKKGATYTVSRNDSLTQRVYFSEYETFGSTDGFIANNELTSSDLTFTNNGEAVLVQFVDSDGWDYQEVLESLIQLEEGTSATTYEPYKESKAFVTPTLYNVPSGTHDDIDINTGRYTQRCKEKTISITVPDVTYTTSFTNFDLVRLAVDLEIDEARQLTTEDCIVTQKLGNFFYNALDTDSAIYIGSWRLEGVNGLTLRVPKGTYADAAAVVADLDGTDLIFELDPANYVTTYYEPQAFSCFKDGTLYNLPRKQDKGYYDSGITITDSTYPINSLVKVERVNLTTGVRTPVAISDCTVASGGLSFTDSGGTDGDYYEYEYSHFGCSTRPRLAYAYPMSAKGGQDGIGQQVIQLDKRVDNLTNKVSTINRATGTVTSFPTNIATTSTETVTIPLGFEAKNGHLMIDTIGTGASRSGVIHVWFTTVNTESIASEHWQTANYVYSNNRVDDTELNETGAVARIFGDYINLQDAYIDGTDLKLVWENDDGASTHSVLANRLQWEVFS